MEKIKWEHLQKQIRSQTLYINEIEEWWIPRDSASILNNELYNTLHRKGMNKCKSKIIQSVGLGNDQMTPDVNFKRKCIC